MRAMSPRQLPPRRNMLRLVYTPAGSARLAPTPACRLDSGRCHVLHRKACHVRHRLARQHAELRERVRHIQGCSVINGVVGEVEVTQLDQSLQNSRSLDPSRGLRQACVVEVEQRELSHLCDAAAHAHVALVLAQPQTRQRGQSAQVRLEQARSPLFKANLREVKAAQHGFSRARGTCAPRTPSGDLRPRRPQLPSCPSTPAPCRGA